MFNDAKLLNHAESILSNMFLFGFQILVIKWL